MKNVQLPTVESAAKCKTCGESEAVRPELAGTPTRCAACWEKLRERFTPVRMFRKHRNALTEEYALDWGDESKPLGRVILFRDGLTLCVRFLSDLNGEAEIVLDETLQRLLGRWPHDYLEVETIHSTFPKGEKKS